MKRQQHSGWMDGCGVGWCRFCSILSTLIANWNCFHFHTFQKAATKEGTYLNPVTDWFESKQLRLVIGDDSLPVFENNTVISRVKRRLSRRCWQLTGSQTVRRQQGTVASVSACQLYLPPTLSATAVTTTCDIRYIGVWNWLHWSR